MNCQDLVQRIQNLKPGAEPRDVARLCLLLSNGVADMAALDSEDGLARAWEEMGLRLQAATDQHAAMTEELESLAASDPASFTTEDVSVLIRAVKVQGQVLQLYLGSQPALR